MSNISPDVQKLKLTLEQYAQIHPVHIEENNGKKIIFSTPTIPTKWRAERLYINEPKTLEWISNFDQDDIMFDIGANVGMYSIWAAATKGINVIAIEPESQNYAVLNKNILLNNLKDKVTALCFAMSDEEKISELNLSSFTAGQALHGFDKPMNTVDVYSEKLEEFKPVFTQGCMAMTIDSLVERGIPSPDHIKIDVDGIEYFVKPMNCPHHHKIYASYPRSYRDLPLRLAEYGTCYRYEKSGQLFGLMRVRSLQMNDAHIYCTKEQFKEEFLAVCNMYLQYFDTFGIEKYSMRLSLHDKDELGKKYVNEPELWIETEGWVREALIEGGLDFEEVPGEAAFYGPKIDVQVWSAIGKEFTLATNQVDFAIPAKFDLNYTDEKGSDNTPLCIHRAPLGTHERFIGFLIEHFGGNFPLWLAPVQVAVLPLSDKFLDYGNRVVKVLKESGIRVKLNDRADKIGSKIRQAELEKINVMLIVGEKEAENNSVSVRKRFEGDKGIIPLENLRDQLLNEIKYRRLTHRKKTEATAE